MDAKDHHVDQIESTHASHHHEKYGGPRIVPIQQEATEDAIHVDLSWRSWLVVFVSCFAILAQVYVVVAAGSVIAFIIRDLGQPAIAGWVIQVHAIHDSFSCLCTQF